ncbi:HWE histidine kinase domain-containing protein [Phenylobacterium sp.]|uniref:sensor histidine kinase n=1 Tax=Phenylobacterium sp. TaxID=1871053 RepID=UPI0011F8283C|nr:HWE histidine kinase domain-containing protein [Phenylobacterium sp.]THD64281.1 MAG: PAS domain S-box protein [Phenylobacterium sp.]
MREQVDASGSRGSDAAFPAGGGELGELIRRFDWSQTSLGPISGWPPALRTATNIVLQSPLPLVMLWGPDGVMIYNDAYSVFAGQRHPRLLGSKVLEGWAEVADFNARVLEVGLAGGTLSFKDQNLTLYRNDVAEQVWMDLNYGPVLGDDQTPAGVLAIVVETTGQVRAEREREEAEARVRASEERFRALVNATSDVVYRMSPNWREMRQLDGRGFLADTESPSIAWIDEYLLPEDQPHILAAIDEAIRERRPFHLEHRVRSSDGSVGWTSSRAVPLFADDGAILEWFGAASDVTARKQAEEHLRLVVNELNHRVKNTLAMMQALGAQTFRNADDLEQAQDKFTGRITALARASDLLTGERGVGAALRDVIERAMEGYFARDAGRYDIEGPRVELSSKTALSLAIALHELATNALKYGAWSVAAGRVVIAWSRAEGERLHLEWRETGGPPVAAPTARGFGSRLIERGLAAELSGEVRLVFDPAGLICRVDAPLHPDEKA